MDARLSPARCHAPGRAFVLAFGLLLVSSSSAWAQLGALASPGHLSKAHTQLEGLSKCQSCHEPGRQVTAAKCLSCHGPIGERMARKKGVHRDVTGDCVMCHVEHAGLDADMRPIDPKTFNHAEETGFALDGRHAPLAADCARCHRTRSFITNSPACASCHKDPHLGQVATDCASCHATTGFAVKTFTHKGLDHFFVGRHAALECIQCHKKTEGSFPAGRGTAVKFKVGTECSSCHTDAHRGSLGKDCASCHSPEDWRNPSKAFHKSTVFPLEGRHLAVPCTSCHVKGQLKGTPMRCYDCHWVRRQDDLYKTRLGNECQECHRPTSWTAVNWDHGSRTGTPLNIAHRLLACDSCHKEQVFAGTRPECVSCHERDYGSTLNPGHKAAGFPLDCTVCHSPSAPTFAGARFDHSTFQRVGQHATLACDNCHRSGVYKGTPRECVGCHQADYQRTQSPNHAAAAFPTTCDSCHRSTDSSWRGASFNHTQHYPLVGPHATQTCQSCHKNSVYKGTSRVCAGCHLTNYQRTTSPNHTSAGFPTTCESCHRNTDNSWLGATFNHSPSYPLRGAHGTAACASCHRNGVYKGTSQDCASCHQADYQRAANPNHVAAGFPTACATCHREGGPGWQGQTFTHTSAFALLGAHSTASCTSCHKGGVYKGTARDCVGCHQPDYQRAANPNHAAAGFPTACESCHKNGGPGWAGASFNHNQAWSLQGTHASTACASCHKNNVYKGTSRDCVGCHQPDYQRAANPNHVSAGFPTACESCHKNGGPGWRGASFNHNQAWSLQGTHASTACASCHKGNVYKGTARDCVGCHQTNYNSTTNPNHAAAAFPTACESCHRNGGPGWASTFNHSATFTLLGMHATTQCSSCHKSNVYRGTARDCYPCHQPKYQASTNPPHASAGFPTTCESCHRNGGPGWTPSTFNHSQYFALVGVHATQTCASCHRNSVYKGTSRVCSGCHLPKYQATRNPNHPAAGFPTTCETCHRATDSSWTQGTFNHTWFPITSGRHANRQCSECHQDGNNFKVFTCLTCHGRSETDKEHQGRAGYRYDSPACYSCHPTGRGD